MWYLLKKLILFVVLGAKWYADNMDPVDEVEKQEIPDITYIYPKNPLTYEPHISRYKDRLKEVMEERVSRREELLAWVQSCKEVDQFLRTNRTIDPAVQSDNIIPLFRRNSYEKNRYSQEASQVGS